MKEMKIKNVLQSIRKSSEAMFLNRVAATCEVRLSNDSALLN